LVYTHISAGIDALRDAEISGRSFPLSVRWLAPCAIGQKSKKGLDTLVFCCAILLKTKEQFMPVIARFYGILIKMYFSQSEHGVPHFHAVYGEFNGVFAIETLEMIEGDLPLRSQKLVKEWGAQYQNELLRMWQNNEFKQLPGLE
jgi:hypothetical protein